LDLQLAALPPHITPFVARKQGEKDDYAIFLRGGSYFAVSRYVPPEFVDEFLWGDELPPFVFAGETLAEVEGKIDFVSPAARLSASVAVPRRTGWHRGYNLVEFQGKIYGLLEAAGEINLFLGDDLLRSRYGAEIVLVGSSVAEVETRIDFIELSRKTERLSGEVRLMGEEIAALRFDSRQRANGLLEEDRSGFIVYSHNGHVYAWRRSLGQLDISLGDLALRQTYGPQDLIIGNSVESVQLNIDLIESARKFDEIIRDLRAEIRESQDALRTELQEVAANDRAQIHFASCEINKLQASIEQTNANAETMDKGFDRLRGGILENIERQRQDFARLASEFDVLRYGSGDPNSIQGLETYRGFKLVRQADRIYAIPEGPGMLAVLDSSSPELIKTRIDTYLTEQRVSEISEQLNSVPPRGKNWFSPKGRSQTSPK
jgi:hypothetical protein